MASTLFDLAAKITLDTSGYESGLNSAESRISSFGSKLSSGLKTVATVGVAAVGAAAAGVVSFAKSGVEAATTFESSFAQLNTIMDTTQMNADDMKTGLMELSSEMGVSASELAETTYNAISATGDTAGALSIVENATKLATAGFTDTASALSVLTTTMNSYKMSSEDLAGVSDSLIAVQNTGVLTVSDLSSSMGKAIATASAYGVDLYNLESSYISLTKNGIDTAEGTTYLRSMLKELGSESSTVAKTIQTKTGKSFSQLTKEGKSLGDVLGVLYDAVDGDTNALMNLWSSTEAGTAASAIVSQGLETFNDNLVMLQESAGTTQNAYDIMTDTLSHKTEELKTNFENLKIAFGDSLLEGVGSFADLISDGIKEITSAVQSGDWDSAFDSLGSLIGNAITKAAESAPEIIDGATSIIMSLGTALYNNADTIIDSSMDVIGKLLSTLIDNATGIGEAAGDLLSKLAIALGENADEIIVGSVKIILKLCEGFHSEENAAKYVEAAESIVRGIGEGLVESVDIISERLPGFISGLTSALVAELPSLVGTFVGELTNLLVAGINSLGDLLNPSNWGKGTTEMHGEGWMSLASSYREAIGIGGSTVNPVGGHGGGGGKLGEAAEQATEQSASSSSAFSGLMSDADAASAYITQTFSKAIIDIDTGDAETKLANLQTVIDGVISAQEEVLKADETLSKISDTSGEYATAEKLLSKAKEKVDSFVESGSTAVDEFAEKLSSVQEQTSTAATTIAELEEKLSGISEKANSVATQLQTTSELIATTITTANTNFADALDSLPERIGQMWSQVQAVFANAPAFFTQLGQSVTNNFMTSVNTIPGKMQTVWTQIKSAFNTADAYNWGADLVANFISGIDSKISDLKTKVQEMAQIVKDNVGFSEPKEGPLSDFHTYAPDMMDLFIQGIADNTDALRSQVQDSFDFRDDITAATYTGSVLYNEESSSASDADIGGKLDAVAAKIDALTDAILNQTWELDGEVVATNVDRRLGEAASMKARV